MPVAHTVLPHIHTPRGVHSSVTIEHQQGSRVSRRDQYPPSLPSVALQGAAWCMVVLWQRWHGAQGHVGH